MLMARKAAAATRFAKKRRLSTLATVRRETAGTCQQTTFAPRKSEKEAVAHKTPKLCTSPLEEDVHEP